MNIPYLAGLAIVLGALVEGILLFFLLKMLKDSGAIRKNYQGVDIPVSAGISFPLAVGIVFFIYAVSLPSYEYNYQLFLLGLLAVSFLGFVDDMLGGRDTLGFKGHFKALFRGKLTTGGLKAIGGGGIALFVAFFVSPSWSDLLINTLLLALFTNMLNLLDLRPGRAVKGFFLFLIIILILGWKHINYCLIAPLIGIILWYFPFDLKAKAMMGDAGSNVLGFALGFIIIDSLPLIIRLLSLLFLIAMHIYTEKFSLSKTIEKNIVLNKLDQLGRGAK